MKGSFGSCVIISFKKQIWDIGTELRHPENLGEYLEEGGVLAEKVDGEAAPLRAEGTTPQQGTGLPHIDLVTAQLLSPHFDQSD